MHNINSGYKRWLLDGVLDKANSDEKNPGKKIIYELEDLEDIRQRLNSYCDRITENYSSKPFYLLHDALFKMARFFIKRKIYSRNFAQKVRLH